MAGDPDPYTEALKKAKDLALANQLRLSEEEDQAVAEFNKDVTSLDVGTEIKDLRPLIQVARMVASELEGRLSDAEADCLGNLEDTLGSIDHAAGYLLILQRRMTELATAREDIP